MKQVDMYYQERKKIEDLNRTFMELINDKDNPMTNSDLSELIKKRPGIYGRFSRFIGKLKD